MDPNVYWEQLGLRKPDIASTTLALAIFAQEYIECDSRVITDYSPFINNYGFGAT